MARGEQGLRGAEAPEPWRPRVVRLGEAEVEVLWWGPVQLALSILLLVTAIISLVLIATQLATGEMPWQAAVVVGAVTAGAVAGAGWLFHHRQVRLRLDSTGLSHDNPLGGFTVAWDRVRRIELESSRRSGPIIHVTAADPMPRPGRPADSGRHRRDVVVDARVVPVIAEAVEHWTGKPLLVRAAGTTVAWRPVGGPRDDEGAAR